MHSCRVLKVGSVGFRGFGGGKASLVTSPELISVSWSVTVLSALTISALYVLVVFVFLSLTPAYPRTSVLLLSSLIGSRKLPLVSEVVTRFSSSFTEKK